MTTYGYIRTSRQRIQGTAGSDPEAQAHQLLQEGVPEANIYRDLGVSGGTGTNSRAGWRALNARLVSGDVLVVVAIDRIGRRWMDTVNAVRDLRSREVRIRSLAQSEAAWVTYLAAEPDTAEAVIGDILTTFMAWPAEQEIQAVSRRTKAGLERARADGKTLGPPPRVDGDQVEAMARLRREGQSLRSIGRIFGGIPHHGAAAAAGSPGPGRSRGLGARKRRNPPLQGAQSAMWLAVQVPDWLGQKTFNPGGAT